jgi:hypothetical protein
MSTRPITAEQGSMCDRFAAGLVTDLMEDALDRFVRPAVVAHVRVCEVCASLYSRMRKVVQIVARSIPHSDSDEVADRSVIDACRPALEAIREERRRL